MTHAATRGVLLKSAGLLISLVNSSSKKNQDEIGLLFGLYEFRTAAPPFHNAG